ncbi:hypothetical protein HQ403_02020 [Candidatus Kaiserbacteria bacterium]|nr:hypothetical protein [Candidatus Kaiserbacteria bacterium]
MEKTNVHLMIQERFAKLPPKLQEAITSTEVAEKLREIAQKYRLHLDQGQILENETYMVLLGVEQAGKYEENLKKELNISSEQAGQLARDVGKDIFLSIRNTLKESTASPSSNTEVSHTITPNPIPTDASIHPVQPKTLPPVAIHNKLESVVKQQSKEIKISPTKNYPIDPYREPIE